MLGMESDVERRSSRRYPIERQVQYKARGSRPALTGSGTTVNMSSGGILFTTDQDLPAGTALTLEVGWPVLLGSSMPLKLVTRGTVVWCEQSRAALRFRNYEFRTRGVPGDLSHNAD